MRSFGVSERLGSLESLDTTAGSSPQRDLEITISTLSSILPCRKRGIPVVGVSFCAYQGQLVVGNKYATAMVEENMDMGDLRTMLPDARVTKETAVRAIQMLHKMAGVDQTSTENGITMLSTQTTSFWDFLRLFCLITGHCTNGLSY